MINVRLDVGDVLARLASADANARQGIANAMNAAIQTGQAAIVEDTPVQTARLRSSIAVTLAEPDNLTASVHTNVEYAQYVEFGTGVYSEAPGAPGVPFTITAKNAQALHFTWQGQEFYRKSVTIQGMRPRGMFRRNIPVIQIALQQQLAIELPRAMRGES